MKPCVYILASKRGGTLYSGVTADIRRRLEQHLDGAVRFTSRYNVKRLVHVEFHGRMDEAIAREKQLKEWNRAWKIGLIEEINPNWNDLRRNLARLD